MENTRFILTCNYIDRVIPALQSRCTPIKLEFALQDVVKHILYILKSENIKFTKESLKVFVDSTVKRRFPDIRSIIEHLQLSCQTGELLNLQSTSDLLNDELNKKLYTADILSENSYYITWGKISKDLKLLYTTVIIIYN